jgi:hypothetical protein
MRWKKGFRKSIAKSKGQLKPPFCVGNFFGKNFPRTPFQKTSDYYFKKLFAAAQLRLCWWRVAARFCGKREREGHF